VREALQREGYIDKFNGVVDDVVHEFEAEQPSDSAILQGASANLIHNRSMVEAQNRIADTRLQVEEGEGTIIHHVDDSVRFFVALPQSSKMTRGGSRVAGRTGEEDLLHRGFRRVRGRRVRSLHRR
jgi:hypothetical protein